MLYIFYAIINIGTSKYSGHFLIFYYGYKVKIKVCRLKIYKTLKIPQKKIIKKYNFLLVK